MRDDYSASTRASLLSRMRSDPNDQTAWEEFVRRYESKISCWCSGWQLQDADVKEVTQMVLVRLAVKMRSFVYDPHRSFRAWLKTLTHHAWSDFVADQTRGQRKGLKRVEVLHTLEARDDLARRLEEAYDLELLEIAISRVQDRVQTQTWQAFQLTAVSGHSGADTASQLDMNIASVFKAKSNIQKMLKAEIELLESGS